MEWNPTNVFLEVSKIIATLFENICFLKRRLGVSEKAVFPESHAISINWNIMIMYP